MSQELVIVARIEAQAEGIELVKAESLKLITPTLKEAGCLQYDLHQDNDNPAVFVFYERWSSRQLWQEHMNNDHLAEYKSATEGAVFSLTIHEMIKL